MNNRIKFILHHSYQCKSKRWQLKLIILEQDKNHFFNTILRFDEGIVYTSAYPYLGNNEIFLFGSNSKGQKNTHSVFFNTLEECLKAKKNYLKLIYNWAKKKQND